MVLDISGLCQQLLAERDLVKLRAVDLNSSALCLMSVVICKTQFPPPTRHHSKVLDTSLSQMFLRDLPTQCCLCSRFADPFVEELLQFLFQFSPNHPTLSPTVAMELGVQGHLCAESLEPVLFAPWLSIFFFKERWFPGSMVSPQKHALLVCPTASWASPGPSAPT